MFFLNKGITFVRFLFCIILGIAVGEYYKVVIPVGIPLGFIALYLGLHSYRKNDSRNLILLKSSLAWAILFLFGILLVEFRTETNSADHFIHNRNQIQFYKAVVVSVPERTPKSTRVLLEIKAIRVDSTWKRAMGKVLGYISGNDRQDISKGDSWIIKGAPSLPEKPSNPFQFDYAAYLRQQNIFAVHFVKENSYRKIGHLENYWWIVWADYFRSFCENEIRKGIKGDNEYYFTVALLLGGKAGLDEKLYQAYSETGTVHALAVSGLHVSLIYFIVVVVFGFLKRIRYGKYLFAVLSILVFWFYAMVTGFSPSVVRAVTMFSVFLIAGILKRNSGIYNSLAFSAFIILCIEPLWILDIGFQFSFLAVVGIAYLYPVMYGWITCKNYVLDKIWSLIVLSIAAQLAVAPLSIYYFHSFPLLFLPFNMFIVPISSLALYTGLSSLIVSKIEMLSTACFWLTEWLVKLMNYMVMVPSGSTFLKIDFLSLSVLELTSFYLFLILFFFSIKEKKYKAFIGAVAFLAIFSFSTIMNNTICHQPKTFAMYHVRKKTIVAFIDHGKATILSDTMLTKNDKDFRFAAFNHLSEARIEDLAFRSFANQNSFEQQSFSFGRIILWNGKKIAIITQDSSLLSSLDWCDKLDFLIVSEASFYKRILKEGRAFDHVKVIIHPSIKEKSSLPREDFYYVGKSGAFIYEDTD